ncbi:MAG: antibiotic biosynthesis monooxygenase [Clostridia bacterium]|nr:antibiotic biosynthesis monooxygenase [Clostridia bacterium]
MIVLNVTYRCRPGMRGEFLSRIHAEGLDASSRAEQGNIKYDYYFPENDGDALLLIEKWSGQNALAEHALTPHFKRLQELKPVYVLETAVERFEGQY